MKKATTPAQPAAASGPVKFTAKLKQTGKTATGVRVPAKVVAALGTSKRPPVRVTIKHYTYRTSIAVMDGGFMLGVNAEARAGSGVAAGDEIEFTVELDTAPREVTVPPDLQAALNQASVAKKFFDGLSYSNRLRLVLAIEAAKAADTRARRIAKIVAGLKLGQA